MSDAFNPYQSPGAGVDSAVDDPARPAYDLYSLRSIALATFLGTPLAGGAILAINFKRLGRKSAAIHAAIWTILITVPLLVLVMFIPNNVHVPSVAFVLPQIMGMYFIAKSLQGAAIDGHERIGGRMASPWKAAGIGLLGLVIAVAVIFAAVAALEIIAPKTFEKLNGTEDTGTFRNRSIRDAAWPATPRIADLGALT